MLAGKRKPTASLISEMTLNGNFRDRQDFGPSPTPNFAEVNKLGIAYAKSHDQGVLLELCQRSHPYLMKYLTMICRGHLPRMSSKVINPDSRTFLFYFLPKGMVANEKNSPRFSF